MAITEKWRMVDGALDMRKRWVNNIPRPIQIKIYGSKKYATYIKPNIEFFCIEEGVRITVPLAEVLELIKDYEDADPAEEDRDRYERDDDRRNQANGTGDFNRVKADSGCVGADSPVL